MNKNDDDDDGGNHPTKYTFLSGLIYIKTFAKLCLNLVVIFFVTFSNHLPV